MRLRSVVRIKRAWLLPMVTAALVVIVVAAGAAAAFETDTVPTFWNGLWWAVSLVTTVGFIGQPPRSGAGAALSAVLMVVGFLLLAMVSASLAALFVRDEERPVERREELNDERILAALVAIESRLAALESRIDGDRVVATPPGEEAAPPTPAPQVTETGSGASKPT